MKENLRKQLDEYIDYWHSDIESYQRALIIGKFLFSFMNALDTEKMSKKARSKYEENVHLIGMFECQFGYNNDFAGENIDCTEWYVDEFKRKITHSKTDLKIYKATWSKIKEYVSSGLYKKYLEELEEDYEDLGWVNDIIDFIQAVKYAEIKDSKIKKKLKKIEKNYVEYEDCSTKDEYNSFIVKSWNALESVCELIDSSEVKRDIKDEL